MLPSVYRVKRYTHAMRRRRVATKEQSTRCDLQDAPRGGAGAGEGLAGEGLEEGAGTERELCTEEGTVDIEHIVRRCAAAAAAAAAALAAAAAAAAAALAPLPLFGLASPAALANSMRECITTKRREQHTLCRRFTSAISAVSSSGSAAAIHVAKAYAHNLSPRSSWAEASDRIGNKFQLAAARLAWSRLTPRRAATSHPIGSATVGTLWRNGTSAHAHCVRPTRGASRRIAARGGRGDRGDLPAHAQRAHLHVQPRRRLQLLSQFEAATELG